MGHNEPRQTEGKRFECRDCMFPMVADPPPPDCPMCGGEMEHIAFKPE